MPSLHRAVTAKERDSVAVLVSQDLHLQVTRTAGQEQGDGNRQNGCRQAAPVPSVKLLTGHATLYMSLVSVVFGEVCILLEVFPA